jgi:hypothetical protein
VSLEEDVRRLSLALAGAALALIGFVITQSILKFILEPIQEQRRLIGEVAHALSIYAYIQDIQSVGVEETRRSLRSLSGRLWARACYELGRKSHRNADSTVSLVPSRSPFPAFLSRF